MAGAVSLSLRIASEGGTDRLLSDRRYLSGLTFRKVAGGGPADLQATLNIPRSAFPDLGAGDGVYVYAPTGVCLWEGFANNPGHSQGAAGESFDLNATGIMTLAADGASPLLYRDTAYDAWMTTGSNTPSANVGVSVYPDGSGLLAGEPAILLGFNPGQPLAGGQGLASMTYTPTLGDSQVIGAVWIKHDAGLTTTDYSMLLRAGADAAWWTATLTGVVDTVIGYVGADFAPETTHRAQLHHDGVATNVSTTVDTLWVGWQPQAMLGTLRTAAGVEVAPPRVDYLLASEVVADLVWRFLGGVVAAGRVSIADTAYQIDQLVYSAATRMQQVLDDLTLYEPDMTWEMLPDQGAGRGFAYRPWPTTPRYIISTRDGFSQPGSDADLCNRIAVSWTDAQGRPQTTVVTSSVPALGGRTRDAEPVSLPDGQGSTANATKLGQAILAAASGPPVSGTAVVARPVLDLATGRMVAPFELEPGYVVRVRETGEDLRCTEVSYAHDDLAATLTLGDPTYTTEQYVAALASGRRLIPLNSGGTYTAA